MKTLISVLCLVALTAVCSAQTNTVTVTNVVLVTVYQTNVVAAGPTQQWGGYVPQGNVYPQQAQPTTWTPPTPATSPLAQMKAQTAMMKEEAKQQKIQDDMAKRSGFAGYGGYSSHYGRSRPSIGFGIGFSFGCSRQHRHTSRCH